MSEKICPRIEWMLDNKTADDILVLFYRIEMNISAEASGSSGMSGAVSLAFSPLVQWSVEELDVGHFVLNFYTLENGLNYLRCYSLNKDGKKEVIALITLVNEDGAESYLTSHPDEYMISKSIRIEYPRIRVKVWDETTKKWKYQLTNRLFRVHLQNVSYIDTDISTVPKDQLFVFDSHKHSSVNRWNENIKVENQGMGYRLSSNIDNTSKLFTPTLQLDGENIDIHPVDECYEFIRRVDK